MNPPPFWSRKPIHRSPSGRARPPSWIHRVDPPPPSPLNPSDAFAFVDPLSSSRIHLFLLRCCPSAPHVGIDLIQHAYLVGAPDSSSATWSCASCLLGRRSDPIRRGGSLRLRQRGRRPAAREVDAFVSVSRCRSSSRSSATCWIPGSRPSPPRRASPASSCSSDCRVSLTD
ncbi:hypothetical protein ACQJBY_007087 [Aegilops geniculata]